MKTMRDITSIPTIPFNGVNYYLPETTDDLITLINNAKSSSKTICVRGAGHSFPMIPTLEQQNVCIYILMSNFSTVTFDDASMQVTVGGGCHLGRDPFDPTGTSNRTNSLFYKLYQHGWAIPEMGGIKHQTVGGFLSTGSSGGSVKYSFDEMLVSITIMTAEDPTPQIRTFSKTDASTDNFYAAGIAMGMFGIIVSATFKCVPTFNIQGTETISTVANCAIDLFGSSSNNLQNFFQNTDYTRLIWWPQSHVQKMVVWQASQIAPTDNFKPNPYEEVPPILGSNVPASVAADMLYSAIGFWPGWFTDAFNNEEGAKIAAAFISAAFYPVILPKLLDIFVPIDNPTKGPQKFQDYWYRGLCMDNEMNDKLMPVKFTELWIPLSKAQDVMLELQKFYAESNENTGSFCIEIYGAKANKFWMSPSFGTDVIRLDVFWFANTDKDPVTTLYQRYWDRFASFNFRCHWGKYLPMEVNGILGSTYLAAQYPHWSDWMAKRAGFDPKNVFVNPYWKTQLGI